MYTLSSLYIPQTALAEGFLICLIEKDSLTLIWISHGTTLKTATHLSPTCLPFVSHILDAPTPVWDPWFYTSYSCLPFVSHVLDALTPVWDPWFYMSYSFVSHLSPICLPHSGCSNARLGPWFYTSYIFVPACLPFVSHILDALTPVWDPWFYSSYSFVSHLSPICLPHSGCSNARLGPLVLLVILICLPLVSHLSPTFWML